MLEGLDLYCCQGGASEGYANCGFQMTGVDKFYQSRYRFKKRFIMLDAREYLRRNMDEIKERFSFIHASCPCQFGSKAQRIMNYYHENLIPETRELLEETGLPFVIENVEDVRDWLINPVMLCGQSFGLRTYRHRFFEAGGGLKLQEPRHPVHRAPLAKMGRAPMRGQYIHAVGNFSGVEIVRQDYGAWWMDREGLRECIPPVYAEYVGWQIRDFLDK